MSSRQHHHRDSTTQSLRRQERHAAAWTPNDTDSEYQQQTVATVQRHTIDPGPEGSRRHHNSSRRDSAATVQAAASASRESHDKSSSRIRSQSNPAMPPIIPAQAVSNSTLNRHDSYFDPYSLRNLLSMKKKKSSKQSPPTSSEKLDETKTARQPLQSRSAYATTTSINNNIPPSTQAYYGSPEDPSSSTRHHRERDRDSEKETEREKRKAEERARRKEKDRTSEDRTRLKIRDHSKDRDHRLPEAYAGAPMSASLQGSQVVDERMLPPTATRHHSQSVLPPTNPVANYVPSSSSSINLISQQQSRYSSQAGPSTQILTHADVDKAARHAKSRDRSRPHTSGQDSGLSSSEQESFKERRSKSSRHHEKRHLINAEVAAEGQPSGASGSETERPHKKKSSRGTTEPTQLRHAQSPEAISRPPSAQAGVSQSSGGRHPGLAAVLGQQTTGTSQTRRSPSQKSVNVAQAPSSASYGVQPTLTVGPSQRAAPQIVSIRAGQGPADPQTPLLPPKSMAQYAAYQTSSGQANGVSASSYASKPPRSSSVNEGMNSAPQLYGQQNWSSEYALNGTVRGTDSKDTAAPIMYSHPELQKVLSNDGFARPASTTPAAQYATSVHRMVMSPPPGKVATLTPTVLVQARAPNSAQAQPDVVPQPGMNGRTPSNDRAPTYRSAAPGNTSSAYPQAPPNDDRMTHSSVPVNQPNPNYLLSPSSTSIQLGAAALDLGMYAKMSSDAQQNPNVSRPRILTSDTTARFPVREDVYNHIPDPAQPAYTTAQGHSEPEYSSRGYIQDGASSMQLPGNLSNMPSSGSSRQNSAQTADPNQSQGVRNPGQGKYSPPRQSSLNAPPKLVVNLTPSNASSYSPSRNPLGNLTPNSLKGTALSTPKHSPSGRIHAHRNGSDDTVLLPSQRPSPPLNGSQQILPQYTNSQNLPSHASSRPDTNAIARPPSTQPGYPDPTRYRPHLGSSSYSQSQNVTSSAYVTSSATAAPSQSYSTQTPVYSSSRPTMQASVNNGSYDSTVSQSAQAPPPQQRSISRSFTAPEKSSSRQYYGVTSPPPRTPSALLMSPPTRTNTFPAMNTHASRTAASSGHSRTASDPQHSVYGVRSATQAHQSSGVPSKSQASRIGALPTSDAPAVQQAPPTSRSHAQQQQQSAVPMTAPMPSQSSATSKESRKKGGFFGLFRSRSTPPKQAEVRAPTLPAVTQGDQESSHSRRRRHASLQRDDTASTQQQQAAGDYLMQTQASTASRTGQGRRSSNAVPLAVPTPVSAPPADGIDKAAAAQYRLLSKRYRTVSSASLDAVDGTVLSRANTVLTGISSARSSTAGRPSPPLRDPLAFAQEWRIQEAVDLYDRGTSRRRRPGVTFDMDADMADTVTQRLPRRRRQQSLEEWSS